MGVDKSIATKPVRRLLAPIALLVSLFLVLIFGIPVVATGALLEWSWLSLWRWPVLLVSPLIYVVAFVVTAGVLSLPYQSGIIAGKFPRDVRHPVYRKRRLYGLCWTAVYYFKPLYFLCLSLPWLKWLLFRLFGYRGGLNFTVYPDTWIRDLPLLDIGEGAYIANRATLGTNLAFINGTILVDRISIGRGSVVGHLSVIGTGAILDEYSEVGMGCFVGLRCKLGRGSLLQPCCGINHLAAIGANVIVGARSYVGVRTQIGNGLKIAPDSHVPSRQHITSQTEVEQLVSSERTKHETVG